MFCLPVVILAILMAASTASDPEFQKKKESREGCGITGISFSINSRYGPWYAMLTYGQTSKTIYVIVSSYVLDRESKSDIALPQLY